MKTIFKFLIIPLIAFSFKASAFRDLDKILNLRGYWKFNIGDNLKWADPFFDDSNWQDIYAPSAWENEGFHGYDGFAWYRVSFELNEKYDPEDQLFLDLGYIDDADEVYINGHLIGRTGSFPPNFHTAFRSRRQYFIPPDIINTAAPNIIAVRVFDTVLDGGILSGNLGIYRLRSLNFPVMSLEGVWKFREGVSSEWKNSYYDDHDWEEVMVPGFWANFKHINIKSYGTYRKKFILSNSLKTEEELVIVLGRIDDFDRVYLNGNLIGNTNDGDGFMISRSFLVVRVYDLPKAFLNRNGDNFITVEVEDIGGDAGIYEGPIAITTPKYFKRLIDNY